MDGLRSALPRSVRYVTSPVAVFAVALVVVVAAQLIAPPPTEAAGTWSSTMIPSSGDGRKAPDIAGDWVVWEEVDGPDAGATLATGSFAHNLITESLSSYSDKYNPRIDGQTMVFDDGANEQIFARDLAGQSTAGVALSQWPAKSARTPDVSGTRVVWRYGVTGQPYNVAFRDMAGSGSITYLAVGDGQADTVRVSGDFVAWDSWAAWAYDGKDNPLMLYRFSTGQSATVPGSNNYDKGHGFDIGGEYLVFYDGTCLVAYNVLTGASQDIPGSDDDHSPSTDGRRVVWVGSRGIECYDLVTHESSKVTQGSGAREPSVSGTRCVYALETGGVDELYVATYSAAAATFPDVPVSHPYYAAINGMFARGVIGGYTNGDFGPDDPVIRQQFAKMIVKTLGLTVTGTEVCPFVDVSASAGTDPFYPAKYVAVCALNNITRGVDSSHFAPGLNIKRSQVITMIVRAADNLAAGTLDEPSSAWSGYLSYADPTHGANIKKAEYNGLLAGIPGAGGSLASWNTSGNASRGEVAQMLWNLLQKLPG